MKLFILAFSAHRWGVLKPVQDVRLLSAPDYQTADRAGREIARELFADFGCVFVHVREVEQPEAVQRLLDNCKESAAAAEMETDRAPFPSPLSPLWFSDTSH